MKARHNLLTTWSKFYFYAGLISVFLALRMWITGGSLKPLQINFLRVIGIFGFLLIFASSDLIGTAEKIERQIYPGIDQSLETGPVTSLILKFGSLRKKIRVLIN